MLSRRDILKLSVMAFVATPLKLVPAAPVVDLTANLIYGGGTSTDRACMWLVAWNREGVTYFGPKDER